MYLADLRGDEPLRRAYVVHVERMMLLSGRTLIGWWDIEDGWVGLISPDEAMWNSGRERITDGKTIKALATRKPLQFNTWSDFAAYCENLW
jgi:hypothetical protein